MNPVYQTLSKVLDILSAPPRGASDLLKALATLSDTTVRRYKLDEEDLKPCCKSDKKVQYLESISKPIFTSFSTLYQPHRKD